MARAVALSRDGKARLALHLAELASGAAPNDPQLQAARSAILQSCIESETSLMGKAFLSVYLREAQAKSKA
jgi:hypothetical protein